MSRLLLPLLALIFVMSAPLSVQAQNCDPTKTNACGSGQVCKSVNNGPYTCVAAEACSPACKSGETCFLGTCIATPQGDGPNTAPTGSGDGPNTAPTPGSGSGLTNPLKGINSLDQLLAKVFEAIVDIGTIILTLALVYVGFLFVVAQGNEEKIRNAKSALLWTVIGGLILLGASAIGAVIKATVGTL